MTGARYQNSGSLVNFQSRERNGAFGPAARVGDRAAERTDQKAEWSGGFRNSSREPQRGSQVLPVWRRSLSRGSQSRQVLGTGRGLCRRVVKRHGQSQDWEKEPQGFHVAIGSEVFSFAVGRRLKRRSAICAKKMGTMLMNRGVAFVSIDFCGWLGAGQPERNPPVSFAASRGCGSEPKGRNPDPCCRVAHRM